MSYAGRMECEIGLLGPELYSLISGLLIRVQPLTPPESASRKFVT